MKPALPTALLLLCRVRELEGLLVEARAEAERRRDLLQAGMGGDWLPWEQEDSAYD